MTDLTKPDAGHDASPDEKRPSQWTTRNVLWSFGTVGTLAIGFIVWASSYDAPPETVDPFVEQFDAQRVCQDFVMDRLKAPSTAEFDTDVSGVGPEYTVTGTVDSENSFGAMLRSQFTCTVRGDGTTWHLVSLSGLS
jgi:hypothetical protein